MPQKGKTLADLDRDPLNPKAWDQRYVDADTPWDLRGPTPEFTRIINETDFFTEGARVLVPGCGRGYDVVTLAEANLRVTALDFSAEALKHLHKMLVAKGEDVQSRVELVESDFFLFAKDSSRIKQYDYVLEYTFFCAIPPSSRKEYAFSLAQILNPNGQLLGLFFPIEEREGGPPYGVSESAIREAFDPFFAIEISQPEQSIPPRKGREILVKMQKLP